MTDWYVGLDYAGKLATWLVASFLLHTLASQIAWQSQWLLAPDAYADTENELGHWIDRLRTHPLAPWLSEAIRFVYYLGIPFLAAISGLLAGDLLGVQGTDWVAADGRPGPLGFLWEEWVRGLGLAATAVLAAGGIWLAGRWTSRRAGLRSAAAAPAAAPADAEGSPLQRLLGVLYDQVHWAFYRSGPILWLDDVYWGVFAGLGLVLIEAWLNPAFRWALKSPETAGPVLVRLLSAWLSALLFLATQNLWLTAVVHLTLTGLSSRRASAPHAVGD